MQMNTLLGKRKCNIRITRIFMLRRNFMQHNVNSLREFSNPKIIFPANLQCALISVRPCCHVISARHFSPIMFSLEYKPQIKDILDKIYFSTGPNKFSKMATRIPSSSTNCFLRLSDLGGTLFRNIHATSSY